MKFIDRSKIWWWSIIIIIDESLTFVYCVILNEPLGFSSVEKSVCARGIQLKWFSKMFHLNCNQGLFDFVQILQKLKCSSTQTEKGYTRHGSEPNRSYTNKLENKWYSFRQTSIFSKFIFTYPKNSLRLNNLLRAIHDYWINSIKIDQMPKRKIYTFFFFASDFVVDVIFRFWMSKQREWERAHCHCHHKIYEQYELSKIDNHKMLQIPFHWSIHTQYTVKDLLSIRFSFHSIWKLCIIYFVIFLLPATATSSSFASLFSPVCVARDSILNFSANTNIYLDQFVRVVVWLRVSRSVSFGWARKKKSGKLAYTFLRMKYLPVWVGLFVCVFMDAVWSITQISSHCEIVLCVVCVFVLYNETGTVHCSIRLMLCSFSCWLVGRLPKNLASASA